MYFVADTLYVASVVSMVVSYVIHSCTSDSGHDFTSLQRSIEKIGTIGENCSGTSCMYVMSTCCKQ